MADRNENILQTATRWAATAIVVTNLLALGVWMLIALMGAFVPADKRARKRMARQLDCDVAVIAEALAAKLVVGLVVVAMWGFIGLWAYALFFT